TAPPHLRVPALHVSGAGRGISRACGALVDYQPGTGQWDPAIIRPTLTVLPRSGNDGAPARHSTRRRAEGSSSVELSPDAPAGGSRGVRATGGWAPSRPGTLPSL